MGSDEEPAGAGGGDGGERGVVGGGIQPGSNPGFSLSAPKICANMNQHFVQFN